jgi:hypothetical protein
MGPTLVLAVAMVTDITSHMNPLSKPAIPATAAITAA